MHEVLAFIPSLAILSVVMVGLVSATITQRR